MGYIALDYQSKDGNREDLLQRIQAPTKYQQTYEEQIQMDQVQVEEDARICLRRG